MFRLTCAFCALCVCASVGAQPAATYIVNGGSHSISQYVIDESGRLISMEPPTVATGRSPQWMAIDSAGHRAFVVNAETRTCGAHYLCPVPEGLGAGSAFHMSGEESDGRGCEPSSVSVYEIDQTSGALVEIKGSPFRARAGCGARSIAVHPSGGFVYLANSCSNQITAFEVDAKTGVLTELDGSPFPSRGLFANSVVAEPSGQFLHVVHTGNPFGGIPGAVTAFAIDSTGAPSRFLGSFRQFPGTPWTGHVDRSGSFLYIGTVWINDQIVWGFKIEENGTLSNVVNAPFRTPDIAPVGVSIDPFSRFLYAGLNPSKLTAFTVDAASGELFDNVPGSPYRTAFFAIATAVEETGNYLYSPMACADKVFAYVIDQTTGSLWRIQEDVATGSAPLAITTWTKRK